MNPDGSYTLDIDRFNNDLSYCLNYTPRLKGLYFYDKPSLYLRFFLRGTEENKDERSRERYTDEELAFADAFLVSTEEQQQQQQQQLAAVAEMTQQQLRDPTQFELSILLSIITGNGLDSEKSSSIVALPCSKLSRVSTCFEASAKWSGKNCVFTGAPDWGLLEKAILELMARVDAQERAKHPNQQQQQQQQQQQPHPRPTPPIVQEAPAAPHPRPTPPNVQEAPAAPHPRPTPPNVQEAPAAPHPRPTPPNVQEAPAAPHPRPTPPNVQEAPAAPHPRPTPPNVQEAPAAPLARPTPPIMQEPPAPQTFLPAPALGVAIATPLVPAQAVVQGYLQGRGERKQRAPRSRKPPTATPKQRAPRSRKAPTATPKNGGSAASSLPEPSGWTQAAAHMPQVPEEARLKRRRTVVFPQLWGWGSPSERPLAAAPPVARAECSCFGGSSRGLCSGGCR